MIKATALLLALGIGSSATRDLVCQVACVEPDAAHATASCHESSDMAGTFFQSVQDHCISSNSSPASTAAKFNAVKDRGVAWSTGPRRTSPIAIAAPFARHASLRPLFVPPSSPLVLRI